MILVNVVLAKAFDTADQPATKTLLDELENTAIIRFVRQLARKLSGHDSIAVASNVLRMLLWIFTKYSA